MIDPELLKIYKKELQKSDERTEISLQKAKKCRECGYDQNGNCLLSSINCRNSHNKPFWKPKGGV